MQDTEGTAISPAVTLRPSDMPLTHKRKREPSDQSLPGSPRESRDSIPLQLDPTLEDVEDDGGLPEIAGFDGLQVLGAGSFSSVFKVTRDSCIRYAASLKILFLSGYQ